MCMMAKGTKETEPHETEPHEFPSAVRLMCKVHVKAQSVRESAWTCHGSAEVGKNTVVFYSAKVGTRGLH